MTEPLNILILSCGTRNKIVQYFKKELGNKGQVMATDCSELAPALYEADKHFIVPNMNDEGYLDIILNICKTNHIKGVLSLIDPELILLSKNREKFLEIGAIPIVSDYDLVELCFDKYKFYEFLTQNNIKTIRSYVDKELFYKDIETGIINYPVFVKPVRGSASININKVNTREEVEHLFLNYDNLMIQEYMYGKEYGVDTYIDMLSGETTAIFVKEKLKMRAGETDKSISVKDVNLFKLIERLTQVIEFNGIIDVDVFEISGEYFISEVNPRFGGGYPHAYECGVNIPRMILNNIEGIKNQNTIGHYVEDIYMMKFNELKIIKK